MVLAHIRFGTICSGSGLSWGHDAGTLGARGMTVGWALFTRGAGTVWMFLLAIPAFGAETGFDANPWVADLHEIRAGMLEKYANFEWVLFEREAHLSELFDATERQLRDAGGDQEAKAIIDRTIRSIGDGHLRVKWPKVPRGTPASMSAEQTNVCDALGYDASMKGLALGPYIPGYRPLTDDAAPEFPAGLIDSGTRKVGVIRIGLFAPQGYPELCKAASKKLVISDHSTCDEACVDRLEGAEYAVMSRDLALRVRELERLGATVLLVDITGNGGGSEWAEAAARILSPIKLRSERREGVRGEHWAGYWASVAADLRQAKRDASPTELAQLEDWARQAEQVEANASIPCSALPFWSGQRPDCEWLAPAFYATGLLAEADAALLHKKPWGPLVFSPAQYDFEESVWRGPLLVLVDGGTGSASEEFAAVLQDNRAAVIIGAPTAGAGCGHTRGGTPVILTHSQGILELPDCARIRRDGSNEIRGVDPDVLVGFRATDGMKRKGVRAAAALSSAALRNRYKRGLRKSARDRSNRLSGLFASDKTPSQP